MKNRVSGLLLEKGVSHTKRRLHKVGYFAELMTGNEEIDASIRPLLKLSRERIVRAQKLDYALVSSLASTANAVWNSARELLLSRRAAGKSTHPWYWAGFLGSGGWE